MTASTFFVNGCILHYNVTASRNEESIFADSMLVEDGKTAAIG